MKNIDDMSGSDIRHYIKQMWKHDKKVYEDLINYLARHDKEFVRDKLIKHFNENINTFSKETLEALHPVFIIMRMEYIDDMTGSDIRHHIKQMWKYNEEIYDELIDYLARHDKEHVRTKLIEHCNEEQDTFSETTLEALRPVFSNMQADVIKESMPFLMYIMRKLSKGKGSKKSKKLFKKKFNQKIKKKTFRKSVSQKKQKNTFRKSVSQKKKKIK